MSTKHGSGIIPLVAALIVAAACSRTTSDPDTEQCYDFHAGGLEFGYDDVTHLCYFEEGNPEVPDELQGSRGFTVCEPMPESGECETCPAEDLDGAIREEVASWHEHHGCEDEGGELFRGCVYEDQFTGECCTTARVFTECVPDTT